MDLLETSKVLRVVGSVADIMHHARTEQVPDKDSHKAILSTQMHHRPTTGVSQALDEVVIRMATEVVGVAVVGKANHLSSHLGFMLLHLLRFVYIILFISIAFDRTVLLAACPEIFQLNIFDNSPGYFPKSLQFVVDKDESIYLFAGSHFVRVCIISYFISSWCF